jgi:hypothetical protein
LRLLAAQQICVAVHPGGSTCDDDTSGLPLAGASPTVGVDDPTTPPLQQGEWPDLCLLRLDDAILVGELDRLYCNLRLQLGQQIEQLHAVQGPEGFRGHGAGLLGSIDWRTLAVDGAPARVEAHAATATTNNEHQR